MKVVLEHLTKRFPNRNKKIKEEVVDVSDFNFEIPDGKLIGLLGPSGCGKSTALNLICGLEEPTEGRIYFGDEDVTDLAPEHRGVGLVFQNYALYPHMTVRENIRFPLTNLKGSAKLTKEEMEARVDRAAQLVQITELMERKPSEMSGGQQQRVAIARALVKTPQVLLLDEPLSNLDARLRLQTREEIRKIQRETKVTTIFVTHDQEEAMSISDLIIVMKKGVVQQIGAPQAVYDDPANLFVAKFLGTPAINVFRGEVRGGQLFIGGAAVLDVPDARDGNVWIGIRPEGFIPDKNGPLESKLVGIEVMGRDITVLSEHPDAENPVVRSIISSERRIDTASPTVRFRLKPYKVFLFDAETEERIKFEYDADAAEDAEAGGAV
ncbi:MAG: ABC transporter ATP-binding protein [Clostridia bacterium]|nr:ABC transporter ATP-binding protein [Clostridia bacterium]